MATIVFFMQNILNNLLNRSLLISPMPDFLKASQFTILFKKYLFFSLFNICLLPYFFYSKHVLCFNVFLASSLFYNKPVLVT